MRILINVSLAVVCSVFSAHAMLRDQASRLVVASVLRTYVQPRLLSGTSSSTSYDDAHSSRVFWHKECRDIWNSIYKLVQTAHSHPNSDAECLEDEGKVALLYNGVAYIKRMREELDIPLLHGFSSYSRVTTAREKFFKAPFPLVAAATALAELHGAITTIIPEIQNVVPLTLEIAGFQNDQRVIEQTLNALKRDWQWTEQCSASIACEQRKLLRSRLKED